MGFSARVVCLVLLLWFSIVLFLGMGDGYSWDWRLWNTLDYIWRRKVKFGGWEAYDNADNEEKVMAWDGIRQYMIEGLRR